MADAPATMDLAAVIDRGRMTPTQIMVAALCATALFVDGYDIQVMALTVPSLAKGWSLPPSSFGLALSAVVIGISVGAGVIGPLGDRIGRRAMLIAAMVTIGVATACTALAATPGQFVTWRLLTGLALGAGIPSCAALTSEYAPLSHRSMVMGLMNVTSPIGAFAAGFIAPPVLEAVGWRGTFLIGGAAPLVIAGLACWLAPESLKFLLVRRPSDPRIAKILGRIAPDIDPSIVAVGIVEEGAPHASPLALLKAPYLGRTLLLWLMLNLNFFILYVLISWLPTLLGQSGWSVTAASQGAVLIQGGGVVGGLTMARFLDRGATRPALVVGFLLSAACLGLFMALHGGMAWVVLLLFLGAGVSGSQLSLNALTAAYYPPAIKATGVSWALLIGGIGSIVGPMAGAWMLEAHLSAIAILGVLTIPALINAACVGLMRQDWQAH